MVQKKFQNEVSNFMNQIIFGQKFYHAEDDDFVWERIVSDIVKFQELSNTPALAHKSKCPLIQIKAERPDILYQCDDFVMGIECFEFDATPRHKKKGSKQKREEAEADKRILEKYKEIRSSVKGTISIEAPINVDFSMEYYIQSLIDVFQKHARNISEYRKNIAEEFPGKKVYLTFYIEDATALGNTLLSQKGREAICSLCVKEFIDELSSTKGLDYVIANIQDNRVHSLHIQAINENFLQSLYQESYDFSTQIFSSYRYKVIESFCGIEED